MPNFTRALAPGGTFFFTLVTHRRAPFLCEDQVRALLRQAIADVKQRRPFEIDCFVLLPDHLHSIWTMPDGDHDFSTRWRKIKEQFSQAFLCTGGAEQPITDGYARKGARGVWQPRFWEHTLRDELDFERHAHYIHYNPVKHGYASCPHAWPWSSFGKWVRNGAYEPDWCCSCDAREAQPPVFDDLEETAIE